MNRITNKLTEIRSSNQQVTQKLLFYLGIYGLLFIIYLNYIRNPFTTDVYFDYYRSNETAFQHHLGLGRFLLAAISFFINFAKHKELEYFLTIFFLAVSFYVSWVCLNTVVIAIARAECTSLNPFRKLLYLLALSGLYVNPMYCDWFPFDEAPVFALGTSISSFCSFLFLQSYLRGDLFSIKNICKIGSLLLLSSGCYQVTTEFFVLQSVFLISMLSAFSEQNNKENLKKWFRSILIIVLLYLFSALFQYSFIKLIAQINGTSTRMDGIRFIENIVKILKSFPILMKNASSTIPGNIFSNIIIILLLLAIFQCCCQRKTIIKILLLLFNCIVVIACIYSPFFVAPVYLALRTSVLLLFLPGLLLIWNLILYDKSKGDLLRLIRGGVVLFIVITTVYITHLFVIRITKISSDLIKVNYLDRSNVLYFYDEIIKYENTTGYKVDKIAFPKDEVGFNAWYPYIFFSYDTNVSGFIKDWSRTNMFL